MQRRGDNLARSHVQGARGSMGGVSGHDERVWGAIVKQFFNNLKKKWVGPVSEC
ncbi:MAG: hypothetical protein GDA48_12405 [Hormoscilla sp. GM102CHS1]|nr:hypothetical protein [Hormoscilla sp. GM102CHS1]